MNFGPAVPPKKKFMKLRKVDATSDGEQSNTYSKLASQGNLAVENVSAQTLKTHHHGISFCLSIAGNRSEIHQ